MTSARDLADRFHQRWLEANPFAATMYGIPGYDDLLPDESQEGTQSWRAEVAEFEQLSDVPDPDLYAWLTGSMPVPEEYDLTVFRRLRGFFSLRPME